MDGLIPALLPIALDVLAALLLLTLVLFADPDSSPAGRQTGVRRSTDLRRLLGPAIIALLLLWGLVVTVNPHAGGQSLVPGPTPTHAPPPTHTPMPTPHPTPTARPTPTPKPTAKPKQGH